MCTPVTLSDSRHKLIIGGDFNCVLNTNLDRVGPTWWSITKAAMVENNFILQNGVSDIWKFKYNKKAFSFFSNVHHTCTRIDYFRLNNRLSNKVSSCLYHSIKISDYGAESFHLVPPKCSRPSGNWRLNPLLCEEQFVSRVINQILFFLDTNSSPEISHFTLWETFRAYLWELITALEQYN